VGWFPDQLLGEGVRSDTLEEGGELGRIMWYFVVCMRGTEEVLDLWSDGRVHSRWSSLALPCRVLRFGQPQLVP